MDSQNARRVDLLLEGMNERLDAPASRYYADPNAQRPSAGIGIGARLAGVARSIGRLPGAAAELAGRAVGGIERGLERSFTGQSREQQVAQRAADIWKTQGFGATDKFQRFDTAAFVTRFDLERTRMNNITRPLFAWVRDVVMKASKETAAKVALVPGEGIKFKGAPISDGSFITVDRSDPKNPKAKPKEDVAPGPKLMFDALIAPVVDSAQTMTAPGLTGTRQPTGLASVLELAIRQLSVVEQFAAVVGEDALDDDIRLNWQRALTSWMRASRLVPAIEAAATTNDYGDFVVRSTEFGQLLGEVRSALSTSEGALSLLYSRVGIALRTAAKEGFGKVAARVTPSADDKASFAQAAAIRKDELPKPIPVLPKTPEIPVLPKAPTGFTRPTVTSVSLDDVQNAFDQAEASRKPADIKKAGAAFAGLDAKTRASQLGQEMLSKLMALGGEEGAVRAHPVPGKPAGTGFTILPDEPAPPTNKPVPVQPVAPSQAVAPDAITMTQATQPAALPSPVEPAAVTPKDSTLGQLGTAIGQLNALLGQLDDDMKRDIKGNVGAIQAKTTGAPATDAGPGLRDIAKGGDTRKAISAALDNLDAQSWDKVLAELEKADPAVQAKVVPILMNTVIPELTARLQKTVPPAAVSTAAETPPVPVAPVAEPAQDAASVEPADAAATGPVSLDDVRTAIGRARLLSISAAVNTGTPSNVQKKQQENARDRARERLDTLADDLTDKDQKSVVRRISTQVYGMRLTTVNDILRDSKDVPEAALPILSKLAAELTTLASEMKGTEPTDAEMVQELESVQTSSMTFRQLLDQRLTR